jgi:hypothetical protein
VTSETASLACAAYFLAAPLPDALVNQRIHQTAAALNLQAHQIYFCFIFSKLGVFISTEIRHFCLLLLIIKG